MATSRSSLPRPAGRPIVVSRLRIPPAVARAWANPAMRLVHALVIAALTGLLVALAMPRGPVTTGEAILLLVTGFVTGVGAAFAMRSRWAMLIAPAAHLAAFELARIGETGPTVDGIHLDTTYGILGLLVGRGVYIVVGLFPMVLGGAYGASIARWLARHLTDSPADRRGVGYYVRGVFGGLGTAAMVALAVWIAIPASVPAVTGPDGEPIEGSVAELTQVNIGGNDQWLEIRGSSADLPVLLYISGGPGQSDLAFSRVLLEDLTQDFLVVGWDQRGNGKSYADWEGTSMTLDRAVADATEVTNYLRERFDEEKIYILGESWGTTLGVLAVQRHPELYHAFIGSGQMVSQRETDRIIYEDLVAWAEEHEDGDLLATLESFGTPPYDSVWQYAVIMQNYEKIEGDYDPPQVYVDRGESSGVGFWGVMGSEYTAIDKANLFRGALDTFAVMYPQLQGIDFRTDVPTLEVPVYLLDGEHELRGRRELAHEWFDLLEAPGKRIYTFENAGHSVAFEQADGLHRILLDEILPATYPGYET